MRNFARRAGFSGLFVMAGAASALAGATARITIDNLDYGPAAVTVRVGDTVEWINMDIVEHTSTAREGAFDVATPKGKPARWRATKIGEFAYFCRFHPNMTGVIRVTR
ncbi:MAG: cupredoxin domain-containing protein [Methylocystis sp.]|nr:cupredoxin domain-containing protein [Methylocystis sp.]